MKIIKTLGDNRYEVEIIPVESPKGYRETEFQIVHDYFSITSDIYLKNTDNSISDVAYKANIHMPIKDFVEVLLPQVLVHEYTQPNHLAFRNKSGDEDEYWPYSRSNHVVHYYKDNVPMVAILLVEEGTHNHVTRKFFELFIKEKLTYKPSK
jgi:hypothetical protein